MKSRRLYLLFASTALIWFLAERQAVSNWKPWWWPPTNGIKIAPKDPNSTDTVCITLSGEWPSACIPVGSKISVTGNNIHFDVIGSSAQFCAQVIRGWSQTKFIDSLSSGTYAVYAKLDSSPYIKMTEFTVKAVSDVRKVHNIDLRPTLEKWKLGPRVQGDRNICSVFTMVGALEYAMASKTHQGTQLSVEFLNWASNQVIGKMDDGGFFSDLWKGFRVYGVCPEEDMPYRNKFDAGLKPSQNAMDHARKLRKAGLRLHWIKPWNPKTGLKENEFLTVKRVLNRGWPVCGGFRWPKKPVRWKNDVLEMVPPDGVVDGHSVLIVGYRDNGEQPGGGVFIFRNSDNNGRDGYMTYEYARTYMNDAVWIDL